MTTAQRDAIDHTALGWVKPEIDEALRQARIELEAFADAMILPLVALKPREIVAIDGVFNDSDMLKTNLDLQCRDAGIRFTCL